MVGNSKIESDSNRHDEIRCIGVLGDIYGRLVDEFLLAPVLLLIKSVPPWQVPTHPAINVLNDVVVLLLSCFCWVSTRFVDV